MYPFRVYFQYASCLITRCRPRHHFFFMSTTCTLKGGCLSITTQGSYWLSSPHPLALSTASRPGITATAETSSRVGTRGRRVPASNQILQEHISRYGPVPGATRLEVGPRESRAGSRVPRYTSPSPTVPATYQGGAVHTPGAPPGGPPSHVPVEAPCSTLADDTAEERLCPYTY